MMDMVVAAIRELVKAHGLVENIEALERESAVQMARAAALGEDPVQMVKRMTNNPPDDWTEETLTRLR